MKDTKNGRQLGDVIKEPDKLIYITVALMLVVMATIIGITAASNRARKNKLVESMNPTALGILYSVVYNGMYMLPEMVLTAAAALLVAKIPQITSKVS